MKKQNLDGRKLGLSKETLMPLQPAELGNVGGGAAAGCASWIPLACFSCQPQGGECKISAGIRC
jgi:hypothetical protein